MHGLDDLKTQLHVTDATVDCPVLGCTHTVARQRSHFTWAEPFVCPEHSICISPSTWEYASEADNLLWCSPAYHESGHAVGAVLVNPPLVVETATIVPDGDYLGQVTYEDWRENLVPDEDDEDSGEVCEHERMFRHAGDIVSSLGAVAEGMLRHGRPDKPVMAGTGFERANTLANAAVVLDEDVFRKAGHYHGPHGLVIGPALALIRRQPHFWRVVGLVAGALMREKTLDGSEVEALVRTARGDDST